MKKNKIYDYLLWIYATILCFLNFSRIFDNNFWGDEAYSIRYANAGLSATWTEMMSGSHPPLYHLILCGFVNALGKNPWVYHFASFFPYLILIVFICSFMKKEFGYGPAILMLTFSSLLSSSFTMIVEVRMYSWAILFVLLAYYSFYMILVDKGTIAYVLLCVFSLCAAYTHYLTILPIAIIYFLLLLIQIPKRKALKVLLLYFATVLLYIPWLIKLVKEFLSEADAGGITWLKEEANIIWSLLYYYSTQNKWVSLLLLVLTFCVLGVLVYGLKNHSVLEKKDDRVVIWLICGGIVSLGPLIIMKCLSLFMGPSLVLRYIYAATGVLWMVLSVGISRIKKGERISVIFAFFIIAVLIPSYYTDYKKECDERLLCDKTVTAVTEGLDENAVICTNVTQLAWTVTEYYWPDNVCSMLSEEIHELTNDKYVLIMFPDYGTEEIEQIKKMHYLVDKVMDKGILGNYPVEIYYVRSN